jgi:hypothetical protein
MRTSRRFYAALPPICTLALVLGTGGAPTSAQTDTRQHTLYVSALDRDGMPAEGLGPDDVLVREDGVRREVLRVLPADEPIDLTVLIDLSTAASEVIPFLRSALPAFLASLTPEHSVALVGLADRPTILVPSTSNTGRLTERAEGLFALPQSGTTLLDAMVEVSAGIRGRNPARAAIVAIVTDGAEFTNRYAKDVVGALVNAQTSVHLITIGRFFEDTEHASRERAFFIEQAPRATGGQHLSMLSPHALDANLQRIARVLTSQYEVVYARPDSLIPPKTTAVTSARDGLTVSGTPKRTRKGA